jgi:hypothetical protein
MKANYTIKLLENEINIIQKCLNEWPKNEYLEAFKERDKRLNELKKCKEIIENY